MQIRPIYWDENNWPSFNPSTGSKQQATFFEGAPSPRSTTVRLIGKGAGAYGKTPLFLFSISGQRVKFAEAQVLPMRIYIEKK
jgi:hypothetical protein